MYHNLILVLYYQFRAVFLYRASHFPTPDSEIRCVEVHSWPDSGLEYALHIAEYLSYYLRSHSTKNLIFSYKYAIEARTQRTETDQRHDHSSQDPTTQKQGDENAA